MGGGAWPILVGGVTCLVNFDNERDPSRFVVYHKSFFVMYIKMDHLLKQKEVTG